MDYTNIAQKSCNRFRNTGCNFTTDNFFSSASLAQHHLEKDFIVLGTLQQNKADILPLIPSTPSEFYSTDFRFSGSLTMFSCVRKRGMAPVHNASQQSGGWKRSEKDQKWSHLTPRPKEVYTPWPDGWHLHLQASNTEVAHGAVVQLTWHPHCVCLHFFTAQHPKFKNSISDGWQVTHEKLILKMLKVKIKKYVKH